MDRIARFTVMLAAVTLLWLEPSACHAQPAAPRQSSGSTTDPRPAAGPALHGSEARRFLRRGSGRPATQDMPQPLPGSLQPANQPQTASDLQTAELKPAPLEASDFGFPINLATALRLSDARPLVVATAQASVWVAEAQLTRAKVIWVPTMTFGADYIRHDGGGPDFNKGVMTAPSVNYFYAGGGLDITNSGIFQFVNLTDAYFEPLVARQVLNSREWDIQAAKNDALLMTADAYFRVHQHRGMYAGGLLLRGTRARPGPANCQL